MIIRVVTTTEKLYYYRVNRWITISLFILLSVLWSLPILSGYCADHPDRPASMQFLGWIRSDDFHRYGSFIDQTRYENRLLYLDYSAIEPQSPRMIALYFFILGILGKITHLPAQHLWLISLFGVTALFVFSLNKVISEWATSNRMRSIAILLILFSGGFESYAVQAGMVFPRTKNFWMDGFSTFCSFHNPLKIAGIICVLWMLLFWKYYLQTHKKMHLAATAFMILFSWTIHPNSAIPGYFALSATLMAKHDPSSAVRSLHHRSIRHYLPLLLPFGIIGMYLLWMRSDPTTAGILKQYQIKNLIEPFRYYPLRYGIILPLGLAGCLMSMRNRSMFDVLFAGWWLGAELFAHFSGMSGLLFQHMVHLPMALFASVPLVKIVSGNTCMKWMVAGLLAATFILQNGYVLSSVIDQTRHDVWPTSLYWSAGEIKAADEFRKYPKGNILVSRDSGNKIGWLALKPVFLGHWGTTPARREKEREFDQFFDQKTSNTWRLEFFERYRIRYIWYGPLERKRGKLDNRLPIEPVIEKDSVTVYRVLQAGRVIHGM
jgi:uncharacterized membrane protein